MIAITGATGALGSRVVRLLAEQRPCSPAAGARRRLDSVLGPTLEIARIATTPTDAGLRAALPGCDTLLLVSARESADRVHRARTVIEAAVDAGVAKIVYISFQGAAPEATFTFARDHWHTEQLILASGISHVFLRDSFYLSGLVLLAGADGVIRGPAGDGAGRRRRPRRCRRRRRDGARRRPVGRTTLDVTGPEALTLSEVAQRAEPGELDGRSVMSRRPSSRPTRRVPATEHRPSRWPGWVSSYQAIATGEVAAVSDTVEQVTGRAPQGFADFLALRAVVLGASRRVRRDRQRSWAVTAACWPTLVA